MSLHRHLRPRCLRPPARTGWRAVFVSAALLLCCHPVWAQDQQATITPNYKDADLAQIVEAVSAITGKNFIIDPRVRAQVTMLSATPMTPSAFYEAFLSILQVHGFVAVPSGNVVKIIPDANARQVPANDLPDRVSDTSDEVVTQIVSVRNVSASQLVPALRPLLPQQAHLVTPAGTNMLIISDRASNVARIMKIVQRLDQSGDDDIDIVTLQNASAGEIVRVVNSLYTGTTQQENAALGVKLVADDRTNSVLITGEKAQRLRLKTLVTHLDTPLEAGGDTTVRYLNYADAEAIAGKLKEQIQGLTQASAPTGGAAPAGGGAQAADRSTTIWADPQTNALVITAPPKIMKRIMTIVDKLDIRRAQVQVEAILVEITSNKASELGINWAVDGTGSGGTVPIGTFSQAVGGASIGDIASAILGRSSSTLPGGSSTPALTIPSGLTLGGGRFQDSGVNFAVLLRALRNDGDTNIISTPNILTLDNEEAEIKVAQEVPFVTGQFTNTNTSTAQGTVNPFQTIQREEVGTILKITPQINEGDSVILKIEQESSSLAQGVAGAVDLITNKRTINTKVMVEDGGIIVLGGLIDDQANEQQSRVPLLGSIPIIGELFRTRSGSKTKRNLMVFIRPTILRDGVQAAVETNAKYNVLRNQQLARKRGEVSLLPGERQPTLPPIEELSRYADPTAGATKLAPNTDESRSVPQTPDGAPAVPPPTDRPAPDTSSGEAPGAAAPEEPPPLDLRTPRPQPTP
ncbi:MAG: type II secretion system secretin GspD [Steroidobacteraceae bacterium]